MGNSCSCNKDTEQCLDISMNRINKKEMKKKYFILTKTDFIEVDREPMSYELKHYN